MVFREYLDLFEKLAWLSLIHHDLCGLNIARFQYKYLPLLLIGLFLRLIVGAPKNVAYPTSGGDVYNCAIKEDGSFCTQYTFGKVFLQKNGLMFGQQQKRFPGRSLNSSVTNGNFLGVSMDGDSHQHGPVVVIINV